MAAFPIINGNNQAIRPSSRSFTPGDYPTKTYRSLSGKTMRRSFGSRPTNFQLTLGFNAVPEATLKAIIDHYNGQYGSLVGFTMPKEMFAGLSADVYALFQNPSNTSWFYVESPQIESVFGSRSNITITLVADLV